MGKSRGGQQDLYSTTSISFRSLTYEFASLDAGVASVMAQCILLSLKQCQSASWAYFLGWQCSWTVKSAWEYLRFQRGLSDQVVYYRWWAVLERMIITLVARVIVTERLSLEGGMASLCFCPSSVNDSYASGCRFLLTDRDMEYLDTETSLNIISLKQIRERACYFLGLAETTYSSRDGNRGNSSSEGEGMSKQDLVG